MIRNMGRWCLLVTMVGLTVSCRTSESGTVSNMASPSESPSNAMPNVVATHSVLCDMVKQVAQETVNLTCLVKAGADAHTYEPTPSDRKALEDANLIFYNGYNFEPGIQKLIESSSQSVIKIAVAEQAVPKPLMGEEHHHHAEEEVHGSEASADHENEEKAEKSEGQEPDPHVWHNAQNGIKMVEVVQVNLAKLVPNQSSLYKKNAGKSITQFQEIDTWIKAQIATIPSNARKLVTTHDSLGYFAAAYGVSVEGALQGLSTEQKPSAARVKELVNIIESDKVPMIFAELTGNQNLLNAIARDAGVKISEQPLFTDGLGEAGSAGETYPQTLMANTKAIVEGLGGRYTAFAE